MAQTPPAQRPRERLLQLGPDALTDAELLGLLLGTGRPGVNAVDLARLLLAEHGGLPGLAGCDPIALARTAGVGEGKAARVAAALTLARRTSWTADDDAVVRSSSDVARVVVPLLAGRTRERVVVVVCGPGNRLRACTVVAEGGAGHATLPVREILAEVLRRDGVAFAVAHNHPGGDLRPSEADVAATAALTEAAGRCGLRFLDHLVVAGDTWRSAR